MLPLNGGCEGEILVYPPLHRKTEISEAFLQHRKKPNMVTIATPALAGLKRVFWTFDPLLVLSIYAPDEDPKDAEAASDFCTPSFGAYRAL
jgi:hypothetical protein